MGDRMNGRMVKLLRKYSKRNWAAFYEDIVEQPLKIRLRIAWYIIKPPKKVKGLK